MLFLFVSFSSFSQTNLQNDSLRVISFIPNKTCKSLNPKIKIVFNSPIVVDYGDVVLYSDEIETMRFALIDTDYSYINNDQGVEFFLPEQLVNNKRYTIKLENQLFYSDEYGYSKEFSEKWSFHVVTDGNKDKQKEDISFYPNPASDYIYIRNFSNLSKLYVINLTGRIVIDTDAISNRLSVSKLQKGVYFITFILKDGRRVSKKLVKK
jgi:hypothetical protein